MLLLRRYDPVHDVLYVAYLAHDIAVVGSVFGSAQNVVQLAPILGAPSRPRYSLHTGTYPCVTKELGSPLVSRGYQP